jgi:hypothetical protein
MIRKKKHIENSSEEIGIFKFVLLMLFCNLFRLLKFIPNNDPIMGSMLPFSKKNKWYTGALFALLTMVSFDIITGFVGVWTIVTALTYAALGLLFNYIYSKRQKAGKTIGLKVYFGSGIAGVLIFDFITGVIATPFMFGMSFEQALIGQIPFTLIHLATVSFFVLIITPILDKNVLMNPRLDDEHVANYLKTKILHVV